MDQHPDDKGKGLPNFFELSISPDQMMVILEIKRWVPPTALKEKPLSPGAVLQIADCESVIQNLLQAKGVMVTVSMEKQIQGLKEWLKDGKQRKIEIAQGTPAVPWQDKTIIIHIPVSAETKSAGIEATGGKVDHRHNRRVTNVEQGTLLITIKPPIPGIPGVNVKGQEIPATEGKTAPFEAKGLITEIREKDGTLHYHAQKNAILEKCDAQGIWVTDQVTIQDDIDYTTGNIEAWGTVEITGSITANFSVYAQGDIRVKGAVESALVKAEGSITVNGGIFGKSGSTRVDAGGDITCLFVENAEIVAGGNVTVKDAVIGSHVRAQKNIDISEKRGVVLTSTLIAGGNIQVKTVGSVAEGAVNLVAGNNPNLWSQISRLRRELSMLKRRIHKGFGSSRGQRQTKGGQKNYPYVKQRHFFLHERTLRRRQQALIKGFKDQAGDPQINAMKKAYPPARMVVCFTKHRVKEECSGGIFKAKLY